MTALCIRRLLGTDAAEFQALRLQGLLNDPDAFGADYTDEVGLDLADIAKRLETSPVFGAFIDDQRLAGIVGLWRAGSAKHGHIARLWGLYVDPAARRLGLARGLIERVLSTLDAEILSVRLTVGAENVRARALYESLGFVAWATDR